MWPFKSKNTTPVETIEPSIEEAQVEAEPSGQLTVRAITYDEHEERIRLDIDWDDEFVAYLKRHGFTGTTDEAIVQRYVASLYRNLMDNMSAEGKNFE